MGAGSLAIWDADKKMAHVVRKDGKYDIFGVTIQKQLYLEYFETLYLIEAGRLQLQFHERILSMEQNYLLLLGECVSKKFCEYLVYAHLTRAGYILIRHKNKHFRGNEFSNLREPNESDCIWAWLCDVLRNGPPVPNAIKKTEIYGNVKRKMDLIKSSIIEQQQIGEITDSNCTTSVPVAVEETSQASENKIECESPPQEIDVDGESPPTCSATIRKRPHGDDTESEEPTNKYFCDYSESYLDLVSNTAEVNEFNKSFKKLEIINIRLTPQAAGSNYNNNNSDDDGEEDDGDTENDDDGGNECDIKDISDGARLRLNFDIYLHSNNFKKSSLKPPIMRVLIISSSECFPNHKEISRIFRNLYYRTPILVVSVGESKQIQAFIYFFT